VSYRHKKSVEQHTNTVKTRKTSSSLSCLF
jgi:hypothetical protein